MTKTEEPLKCKDRVASRLTSRISDLRRLWKAYQEDGEGNIEDLGNIFEYGLSFDYVQPGTFGKEQREGYFRYQLSCGGPSDEFRFFVGPEFEPSRVEYWFLDWFDGAHLKLSGKRESLLLETFDWFKEGGAVQSAYDKAQE